MKILQYLGLEELFAWIGFVISILFIVFYLLSPFLFYLKYKENQELKKDAEEHIDFQTYQDLHKKLMQK